MKTVITLALAVVLAATAALGGARKNEGMPVGGEPMTWGPLQDDTVDVVIVSVEEKFTPEQLDTLLKKYNMTVVYDYQSFHMYAFRLEKALNRADMDTFLAQLEQEEGILFAEPDSKMELLDGERPLGALGTME